VLVEETEMMALKSQ